MQPGDRVKIEEGTCIGFWGIVTSKRVGEPVWVRLYNDVHIGVNENDLTPVEKSLDTLMPDDVVVDEIGNERKVLVVERRAVLLSDINFKGAVIQWDTPEDLKRYGYTLKEQEEGRYPDGILNKLEKDVLWFMYKQNIDHEKLVTYKMLEEEFKKNKAVFQDVIQKLKRANLVKNEMGVNEGNYPSGSGFALTNEGDKVMTFVEDFSKDN